MEKLLHYAWKHKILPLQLPQTTDGMAVEIIDPGMANRNAGPDFFNAKIRIGGMMWAGNVELHMRSSDWYHHGHHENPAYDNVILHVAVDVDCEIISRTGKVIPQMQMPIPERLRQDYQELLTTMDYPRCHRLIPQFDKLKVHAWMDALINERLRDRASLFRERLTFTGNDWERAYRITLARSFGFSLNGDAFERWARIMPFQAAAKHRDDLRQVEALFLGVAGLLEKADDEGLTQEYRFLKHKFGISEELQVADWRYMRCRPQNFPHVRLRQLARLFQQEKATLSQILEAEDLQALQQRLKVEGMTKTTINLLVINAIAPTLYAYAEEHDEERFADRAVSLLEGIKAEDNYILRQWKACGLTVDTAADSQALIQLKRMYCDRKDCLRCRFGYEFLKAARTI